VAAEAVVVVVAAELPVVAEAVVEPVAPWVPAAGVVAPAAEERVRAADFC
jgi:hypothetical protein